MKITSHTFLVTGGASGLGEATVRKIVKEGGNAVILDMNEQRGQDLANELGAQALFVKTNIVSEEEVTKAIAAAVAKFGGIHGVINCAGVASAIRVVGRKGPYPLAEFNKVISINLTGTFNVLRLAAAQMAKQEPVSADGERGVIINTASVAAYEGQIGQAAYSASKGGVLAMTLPISRELASFGIRCMCIAPGTFETPLLKALPQKARDSLATQVPFPKRLGNPSEFAELVGHIIENSMLNGESIRIDGSIRMSAM